MFILFNTPWTKYLNTHFARVQNSGIFQQSYFWYLAYHGPNVSMNVLDRIKFQGPFGMNQMSQWTFCMGPNVLQGLQYLSYYLETDTSLNRGRNFSEKEEVHAEQEDKSRSPQKSILWKKNFKDNCLDTTHKIKSVISAVLQSIYTHFKCIQIFCIIIHFSFMFFLILLKILFLLFFVI